MKIVINKKSWPARAFLWSHGIWDEFCGGDRPAADLETNLCYFIRTTFVSTPLAILLNVATAAAALAALTVLPIHLFGFWPWAGVATAIAAWVGLVKWTSGRDTTEPVKQERRRAERASPSMAALFWAWIRAQKQKVCPLISFEEKADA